MTPGQWRLILRFMYAVLYRINRPPGGYAQYMTNDGSPAAKLEQEIDKLLKEEQ